MHAQHFLCGERRGCRKLSALHYSRLLRVYPVAYRFVCLCRCLLLFYLVIFKLHSYKHSVSHSYVCVYKTSCLAAPALFTPHHPQYSMLGFRWLSSRAPPPPRVCMVARADSGPAGYTASIYAGRANLKPLCFEGLNVGPPGGQLMTTTDVREREQDRELGGGRGDRKTRGGASWHVI